VQELNVVEAVKKTSVVQAESKTFAVKVVNMNAVAQALIVVPVQAYYGK
jgi:hypothetical protein